MNSLYPLVNISYFHYIRKKEAFSLYLLTNFTITSQIGVSKVYVINVMKSLCRIFEKIFDTDISVDMYTILQLKAKKRHLIFIIDVKIFKLLNYLFIFISPKGHCSFFSYVFLQLPFVALCLELPHLRLLAYQLLYCLAITEIFCQDLFF